MMRPRKSRRHFHELRPPSLFAEPALLVQFSMTIDKTTCKYVSEQFAMTIEEVMYECVSEQFAMTIEKTEYLLAIRSECGRKRSTCFARTGPSGA